MTHAMREIDEELADPERYVRLPGRIVFDEHEETYYVDKAGRPCSEDKPGAVKKVRRFHRKRLEQIARQCNRRDRTGSLSPLALGHTDPKEKDETKQPRLVGYAKDWRVAYSKKLGRNVIATDFYVRKEDWGEARTFPRVSVELWDKHDVIDPVALLRRTPARDIGQWTYGRDGPVLRYSMGGNQMPMDDDDDVDMGEESHEEPGGDEAMPHHERVERFMRHCYSHPDAAYVAQHYAMEPEGEEDMGGDDDQPSPAAPPSAAAGDEEPMMHGMAAMGATNGKIPSGKKPMAKKGKAPSQFSRDAQRIKAAKEQDRVAALEAEVASLRKKSNMESGKRYVTQLLAEGYELDPDEEAIQFSRRNDSQREQYADKIRQRYRRAPVGVSRPVPLERTKRDDGTSEHEPKDEREMQQALDLVRNQRFREFDEALQYVRKGSANGTGKK